MPTPLDSSNADDFLKSIDVFVFDCDGVLWHGGEPNLLPGVAESLQLLKKLGKKFYFVTNNSTTSRANYVKKLQKMGIEATAEQIIGSAYAAAKYLESIEFKKNAYVLGGLGIVEELKEVGIETAYHQEHNQPITEASQATAIQIDQKIGAVVCGLDFNLNYYKYVYAYKCLTQIEGCLFVATNLDQNTTNCQ
eukprot:TRINITY_DN5011_c0_g1_i2.p1 TRINITY_DN5011_c0_g1~~TRINITY_DN5011_c0_g1_i2.p1  ORF type:complete len:193 (+),score=45.50 TRINITY_DN5011_c0_g1_i2:38-616(+)